MAISKVVMSAIKAISYTDMDIRKTYIAERKVHELGAKLIPPKSPEYETWDRKVYCDGRIVPVRVYPPVDGDEAKPMLVFFHGGGWVLGNIDTYDSVCVEMARQTNRWVVSVDYSLAPEKPFPAGLRDCYAVVKELYVYGIRDKLINHQITIIGDSAGGNLAAALSLMARDEGEFGVEQQILIYPALSGDYSENSPFASVKENGTDYLLTAKRLSDFMELYHSSAEDFHNPYFAPLQAKSLENQPRTLIITAEFDPLRDEGEYYGERLRKAGNDVTVYRLEDAIHGCFTLPYRFEVVQRIYKQINRFLGDE